jgi:sugar transferase EpsL
LDLSLSLPVLLLIAPFVFLTASFVRLFLGHPVLFRQERPGLRAKPFTLLKFRTMTDTRDASARLQPDAVRLSGFGRFLRSASLDELPELWNVVRGDLSLVGPRPLLMQYLNRYTPEQARRHDVRPGITGWAQVNGRNALNWEQKFALDIWYVDNHSLWIDLKILALTVLRVFQCKGISAANHATMPEFLGPKDH